MTFDHRCQEWRPGHHKPLRERLCHLSLNPAPRPYLGSCKCWNSGCSNNVCWMQAPCSGLKSVPPDSCPPDPQEMGLFGNTVFADVILSNHIRFKVKSHWIRMGPNSDKCPYKRQKRTRGDQSKPCEDGERCVYHRQHPEWSVAPGARWHAWDGFIWISRRSQLPMPWLWTSGLQHCTRVNYCHQKPPNGWHFIVAALGSEYMTPRICKMVLWTILKSHLTYLHN